MSNNQVSFKSRIVFMNSDKFFKITKDIRSTSKYPWTYKEIVRSDRAYTNNVQTCTAGGIIVEKPFKKREVVMFHLCPPEEETPENSDFQAIVNSFLKMLGKDKPVQGFILGSKRSFPYSLALFEKIEGFFKELSIPYSKFKVQKFEDWSHIAYDGKQDTWFVNSSNVKASDGLHDVYGDVLISSKDTLELSVLPNANISGKTCL